MNYVLVCPIGVIGGKHDLLTYHTEDDTSIGQAVKIPFGRRTVRGVIFEKVKKPAFKTKPIESILPEKVPSELLDLSQWIAEYYAVRLAVVLQTVLPTGLGKKRRVNEEAKESIKNNQSTIQLSDEQKNAIEKIQASSSTTHLLHGVTGSGKTTVYKELAKKTLANGKSVLVLVPEIALTPQLAQEFSQLSSDVTILHSELTEANRHILWQKLNETTTPQIVVGPRSALFSPLKSIGLIVVDECHEPSFIQDSQPKYSALRVARKLADLHQAKLILGSATPLISDYFLAEATKTPIIKLKKAINKISPEIEIIDSKDSANFGANRMFSKSLLAAIKQTLNNKKQVMLFHNRRGTARQSICGSCGWVATCTTCHIPMRLHHDLGKLRCHVCNLILPVPTSCPECSSPDITFQGFGSKRIEQEIRKLFVQANIARFDSDNLANEQLHHRYNELKSGEIDIIIGTQGIAKGLDLPHLDTVGVVQADSELFIPDFSSSERSFQLLTQVIGRAGRAGQASRVIIQTLNPEHAAIQFASQQDYAGFYKHEISERRLEHMPPHTFMLQLTTGYSSVASARNASEKLKTELNIKFPKAFVRGPSPAFHEHRGSKFYQQLVVTSSKRSDLQQIAKDLPQRWQFTLDPLNLL